MPSSFDYALVRIVPRVDREEFMNAGVVVFCPEQNFLGARVRLDELRMAAFAPHIDMDLVKSRLSALAAVCAGEPNAGPVAKLGTRERFHWVVSPRSTILQMSPVHSGVCSDPERTLADLFKRLCV
jgi:hypothetical protein